MPTSAGNEKLVQAYNRMMERVKALLEKSEDKSLAALGRSVNAAKDKAVELGELSREEAGRIGSYLRRDLEDAGAYLASSGNELESWLHFDIGLVEDRLWEAFTAAADQTKLAFLELAEQARRASEYKAGDVTTVGTLQCENCGELLHLHATGPIPPCPHCGHPRYIRTPHSDA